MNKKVVEKIKKKVETINNYIFVYGLLFMSGISFVYANFLMGDLFMRMGYKLTDPVFRMIEYPMRIFGFWVGTTVFLSFLSLWLSAILKNKKNFDKKK